MIQSHYENENPFDVIVIDQLIDILSRTGKGKVERISQAYQELKLWIQSSNRMKVLGIMPAQLKQSVVDYLRKTLMKPLTLQLVVSHLKQYEHLTK